MVDIWGRIKDTTESLGGAVVAPVGAVWDIAHMPFDDKADGFGTVLKAIANRSGAILDPVVNPQTLTGDGIHRTLDALNWAYANMVDEPLSTAAIMQSHAFGGRLDNAVVNGQAFEPRNWAQVMDPGAWAKAYQQAQHQTVGQSVAFQMFNRGDDPFNYDKPYAEGTAPKYGKWAGLASASVDLTSMFTLDPAYAGLKVAGVARANRIYGKLTPAERADFSTHMVEAANRGLLKPGLKGRTDKFLGFIGGDNPLKRPLNAQEIHWGTPELRRYSKDPEATASFLADANKIENPVERANAQRRILAVAMGDQSQIDRIAAENQGLASLRDQLANWQRGKVIDLDALGVAPELAENPIFRLRIENQLKNLDDSGEVSKFFDTVEAYNNRLLQTQHSLSYAPGVHQQGLRTLNRMNDEGLARLPKKVQEATIDSWAAGYAQKAQSTSSVFQKGKYGAGVVALKTVGLGASVYTKALPAASDALRTQHFTGVVPIHEWGYAVGQFDSFLRLAEVHPEVRGKLMNAAYGAFDEPAKMKVISQIESAGVEGLRRLASERLGHEIDSDWLTQVMQSGFDRRNAAMASMQGRVYAATQMPDEMAARMTASRTIEDKAAAANARAWGSEQAPGQPWRLDMIDDHGTPIALPMFETQLGNFVPMLDINVAKDAVMRNSGHMARLSKAWRADGEELTKLQKMKDAGVTGLDKAIEARQASRAFLVSLGQIAMRTWKYSVLFRLGYPMRVLMDDHLRLNSVLGPSALYGPNLGEFGRNFKYNHSMPLVWRSGRSKEAQAQWMDLTHQKQLLEDRLQSYESLVHEGRRADLNKIDRALDVHSKRVVRLQKAIEDAETKHSLGIVPSEGEPGLRDLHKQLEDAKAELANQEASRDCIMDHLGGEGPDELRRQLDEIEAKIKAGPKALRKDRKHIGMEPIKLPDGTEIEAPFAGAEGEIAWMTSRSQPMWDALREKAEDRSYRAISGGNHQTYLPKQPGYGTAWADALNHQIMSSRVGRFFIEDDTRTVADFVKWIKQPEQADLRRRVPHFAYDAEDWGHRVQGVVHAYVPNEQVRQALLKGRVSAKDLEKLVPEDLRPAVHGRAVADNLGISAAQEMFGNFMNRAFKVLGEMPTDKLSRHPAFNSFYRQHVKEIYSVKRASHAGEWTQDDLNEIARLARRNALKDLKSSLFDLSSHSHAAHVLRFISPFFAAHQEGVSRWWRIGADNPQVIRRFVRGMDVPRYLGIEVDADGNLVEPGAPLSPGNRILIPGTGGKWGIQEGAFNVVLQGGLTNPGFGPVVAVPADYLAQKYADDDQIARMARVINPYPATDPADAIFPAWAKRLSGFTYGKTGFDPSLVGIGKREYNQAYGQIQQDLTVDFLLKHDREPNAKELDKIRDDAGALATAQMGYRFLWNIGSPTPASPGSKYAAIQDSWRKVQEQAYAQGKDFDWAWDQWSQKNKDAYLPLVYSGSNNPGWVDMNPASVAAIKMYKGVLRDVDPALTRMVTGPAEAEMIEKNATLGEFSPYARNWLSNEPVQKGSDETYLSYDNPAVALVEQQARRGWQKYGELTAGLNALAAQQGLDTYEQSPQLVAMKRAAVAKMEAENPSWSAEWNNHDDGAYDRLVTDMHQIADAPELQDTTRPDIQALKAYLIVHDLFAKVMQARLAAGVGGPDAQSSVPLRRAYTAIVDKIVASNTYFEQYAYNGTIERDPLLYREAS